MAADGARRGRTRSRAGRGSRIRALPRRYRLGAFVPLLLAAATAFSVVQSALPQARAVAKPEQARSFFPRFGRAVPVLLYHRLAPGNRSYSVAPDAFEAQMRRLRDLGFEAITLDEYVRFVRGEAVDLPERPILITFDDGYLSAWKNADPVLARYGWKAAMYVPTGSVGRPGHLTWDELRQMQASGRWQIDEHAGDGHVLVTADAAGRRLPFYASELWAEGRQESFSHYTRRVSGDIERGLELLAGNLPGWGSHGSFAVPFNNYGQNGSNDPRIEPWLSKYLTTQFAVIFVQRDDSFTAPGAQFANRITVSSKWDADTLELHLRSGLERLGPVVERSRTSSPSQRAVAVAKRRSARVFPRYDRAVPVLLYHRLAPAGVPPAVFDAQMGRLRELGFDAITLEQYVRFVRGDPVDLPPRPVLISFDDGFLSSWKQADPVLARYGWSAVMYVATGLVGLPGRLTWDELRQMQASGRWQIDPHAGDGHVLVPVDASGRRAPFYANERWLDGKQESFAAYKRRVRSDIELSLATLAGHLPGWSSHGSFAVPFGAYGQNGSNDRRIEPWLAGYLETRFTVVLAGSDAFTTPGPGFARRIAVSPEWNADALEMHLLRARDRLEPAAAVAPSPRP